MAESKSAALPLGYAPIGTRKSRGDHAAGGADHSGGALPDQLRPPARRSLYMVVRVAHARPPAVARAPPLTHSQADVLLCAMTLPRPRCRHRLRAQARRRPESRAGRGALWRPRRGNRRFRAGRGRPIRRRGDRAAQCGRRQVRHPVQGRRRHHPARLEGGLYRLGRRRLERACRRRPRSAARSCRTPSTPPASKCGIRPRWPSASARC